MTKMKNGRMFCLSRRGGANPGVGASARAVDDSGLIGALRGFELLQLLAVPRHFWFQRDALVDLLNRRVVVSLLEINLREGVDISGVRGFQLDGAFGMNQRIIELTIALGFEPRDLVMPRRGVG